MRAQLPSDLLPLFEKVGRSIKAAPGQMRTETFLRYAEKHPEEVLATSGHEAHTRVADLEAHERSLKKGPNAYEAKRDARIERMRTRAEKLRSESEGASQRAHAIADHIPFGQPILVGHHSERRHRRDIERIQKGHTRSVELAHEADALDRRAERAEHSRAVSSDDPDAVEKLREKLERIERDHERMVAANRAVRSADPRAALRELGFSEALIEKALTPDFLGRVGFPDYVLRNAAAEARRIRVRIATLEKRAAGPSRPPMLGTGVRVEEGENRVRIVFDAKPDETLRSDLKRAGFHWSPSAGAWQRHASNAAWEQATRIVKTYEPAPIVQLAPVIPFRPSPVTPIVHRAPEIVAPTRRVKGEGLDTAGVAKRIREDIALDVREGRLPRATYSVRTERFSMGSSITLKASGFDFPVLNADAFHVVGRWVELDRARNLSRLTDEARRVERTLNAIVDGYHWDRSDPMTDYSNVRFYRHVDVEPKAGEWEAIKRQKLAEVGIEDRS